MKDNNKDNQNASSENPAGGRSRRDALKAMGVTLAGMAAAAGSMVGGKASAASPAEAPVAEPQCVPPHNPYGGGPGTGLTLPPYYRPTPSVKSNNNYFPTAEELGADEMRISFLGSVPFPAMRNQAGTCIMVELGNGKRFFFDFGSGCVRNIVAMQVPLPTVNDIFLTHLHVDHYADLPYLYAFAPWAGRWKPLRVYGPSGRTPENGTKAMIKHMQGMTYWHTDSFNNFPIGDGYEVEVTEFDFQDDNGICYDQDGVTVRHWRRSHGKDGASAYRLDWNGLSFVWTGDGLPDKLTTEYSKGCDVFVTEIQPDLSKLFALKFGLPTELINPTIDVAHTPHYGAGYQIKQVNPRLGMVTHFAFDEELLPELMAGVRTHWDGLFQFGAPDVVVVNVTKDAIWTRKAALPESSMPARPNLSEATDLFNLSPTHMEIEFPTPRKTVDDFQEQSIRDQEYDRRDFYPPDVYRPIERYAPKHLIVSIPKMVWQNIKQRLFGE